MPPRRCHVECYPNHTYPNAFSLPSCTGDRIISQMSALLSQKTLMSPSE
jgi:hypothetical protein